MERLEILSAAQVWIRSYSNSLGSHQYFYGEKTSEKTSYPPISSMPWSDGPRRITERERMMDSHRCLDTALRHIRKAYALFKDLCKPVHYLYPVNRLSWKCTSLLFHPKRKQFGDKHNNKKLHIWIRFFQPSTCMPST